MDDGHEKNNRWHLDKRVSVGHLITTIAVVGAAALWLLRLEGRIEDVLYIKAGTSF